MTDLYRCVSCNALDTDDLICPACGSDDILRVDTRCAVCGWEGLEEDCGTSWPVREMSVDPPWPTCPACGSGDVEELTREGTI